MLQFKESLKVCSTFFNRQHLLIFPFFDLGLFDCGLRGFTCCWLSQTPFQLCWKVGGWFGGSGLTRQFVFSSNVDPLMVYGFNQGHIASNKAFFVLFPFHSHFVNFYGKQEAVQLLLFNSLRRHIFSTYFFLVFISFQWVFA